MQQVKQRKLEPEMTRPTSEMGDDAPRPADNGTSLLFWGWIVVTLLNLGMVSVSLLVFAP
jgi:hypothetical protein